MNLVTNGCRQYGHPEFVLEADEAHVTPEYLENARRIVEDMVSGGSVFRPGQTFQIGWMLTHVVQHDSERLALHEPDMSSMPIKSVPGITHTLRTLMLQLSMLDSVSLRGEIRIPVMTDGLIACTRHIEPDFFMHRSAEPRDRDSGWFVGCLDPSHDHQDPANLRCLSLYETYLRQRAVQGFLSFPVGAMIVLDQNKGMSVLKDGQPLDIVKGSFLGTWFEKKRHLNQA